MALRPICEPVELPLGASVMAERVAVAPDAVDVGRFMHFHDVAELVLFRRVSGEFIAGGRRYRLEDGAIVFVPSMHHHDFVLDAGPMEWVLVQMDPYLVEALALGGEASRLTRSFCAWPGKSMRKRLAALADWLIDAAADGMEASTTERLVELLLLTAARAPEGESAGNVDEVAHVERLRPALERLRASPGEPLGLEAAAAVCHLSPTYFSRRFRQVFGMPFTDYARMYRLHLAARRLVNSGAAISEIAYGVGFSSPAHFTARFRERFGMTPREYRNSARTARRRGGK
jgi:AraC-like DNA-binding protein/mannose-6-phosphate isomerase-like protein (cupin superfamily)